MDRYSLKELQQLDRAIDRIEDGSSELSATLIRGFASTLWLNFLNADPSDAGAIWFVYKEFTRAIEDIKDWIIEKGHSYSESIRDIKLLPKEEFLELYPLEMQSDAQKLHGGMSEIIDEERAHVVGILIRPMDQEPPERTEEWQKKHSEAEQILTRGADIPPSFFTMVTKPIEQPSGKYSMERQLELHLPTAAADHRNLWLSIIVEGMTILAYKDGEITARRCAAEGCGKFFVPTSRGHAQKYHSKACQNREYMRKWRNRK